MTFVRRYRRRKPEPERMSVSSPQGIYIMTPAAEQPSLPKPPLKTRIRRAFAVPEHLKKKKKMRPRTEFDDIADGADEMARKLEAMNK